MEKINAKITQSKAIAATVDKGGIGGISDYEILNNKPKINGIELLGDKSIEEFGNGKHLTTNDLTDELKTQYDAAQPNVIEGIKINGKIQSPEDKFVSIDVPTDQHIYDLIDEKTGSIVPAIKIKSESIDTSTLFLGGIELVDGFTIVDSRGVAPTTGTITKVEKGGMITWLKQ